VVKVAFERDKNSVLSYKEKYTRSSLFLATFRKGKLSLSVYTCILELCGSPTLHFQKLAHDSYHT